MKKILILCACLISTLSLFAQEESAAFQRDKKLFNHWSIGLNIGTPGIGADIATVCTDYLQIRAGFTMMPKVKYDKTIYVRRFVDTSMQPELANLPTTVESTGKLNMVNGDVLFSVYPFRSSRVPVALTAGLYFGTSDIIDLDVTSDLSEFGGKEDEWGLSLNGYTFPVITDQASGKYISGLTLNTKKVKPYLGLSFGRAVPKTKRVGCMLDLGVMFWSTPKVKDFKDNVITTDDVDDDADKVLNIINKFSVYPVINFRINGRFF